MVEIVRMRNGYYFVGVVYSRVGGGLDSYLLDTDMAAQIGLSYDAYKNYLLKNFNAYMLDMNYGRELIVFKRKIDVKKAKSWYELMLIGAKLAGLEDLTQR